MPSRLTTAAAHAVQQADERPERLHEELGRLHDQQRRPLGALERNRFRRQLAEHDVQGGDDRERDGDRDAVAVVSAIATGRNANTGWMSEASAGSPIQPRPMLAIVMPSCVAAM